MKSKSKTLSLEIFAREERGLQSTRRSQCWGRLIRRDLRRVSLSGLVADSEIILAPGKRTKKRIGTAATVYIQTILIQLKTAVKNTVIHRYPKDHIFCTLYSFLQYNTVYSLTETVFKLKKKRTQALLSKIGTKMLCSLLLQSKRNHCKKYICYFINTLKAFL